MQQAWKLARQYGVQYVAVLHRLSDLDAAGHADPRTTRRYDRARGSLDRHPGYALASYLAE